ncbi:MAG: MarR family transcriptional regulator [Pseudonocardiales bacterium]|nr:MarR family transcriptional regulator [Pseudonocardiales bacterium]
MRSNGPCGATDQDNGGSTERGDAVAEVLVALRRLARGIDTYRFALGDRLDLGLAEILALGELLFDQPLRAGDVQARTGLTQGSITALLDRLEGRDLIRRSRPPHDRRIVAVTLTDAGREVAERMYAPLRERLGDGAAAGDAPDARTLVRSLTHLADVLDPPAR